MKLRVAKLMMLLAIVTLGICPVIAEARGEPTFETQFLCSLNQSVDEGQSGGVPIPLLATALSQVCAGSPCGHLACRGQAVESPCLAGPGKVGICTALTSFCSVDGLHPCACKWPPPEG